MLDNVDHQVVNKLVEFMLECVMSLKGDVPKTEKCVTLIQLQVNSTNYYTNNTEFLFQFYLNK